MIKSPLCINGEISLTRWIPAGDFLTFPVVPHGPKSKATLDTQACLEIQKQAQKAESERRIPFLSFTVPGQELSSAALLPLVGFALLFSIEAAT